MPNPLVVRIALSRQCARGSHDECEGDAGGSVTCACLCHRAADSPLDGDAGGMLTEQLAQRGVIDALDRIAAYVDTRWPGRTDEVDLLDHITRGLADEVAAAVDTATGVLRAELEQVADRHAVDVDGPLYVAILLTGRGFFVSLLAVASRVDAITVDQAVVDALSVAPDNAYVHVLEVGGSPDPVLEIRPSKVPPLTVHDDDVPVTSPARSDDASPSAADDASPVAPAAPATAPELPGTK